MTLVLQSADVKAITTGSWMAQSGVVLVTGGTGSFGHAFVERYLHSGVDELRILSRDEKKQDDMRRLYSNAKLKFYLGDVRDAGCLRGVMQGVDSVFHAAALKQVPSCEFHPMEAVKTNVLGTENVLESAIDLGVRRVVVLSTDKAVYPINAMGTSKAMAEKVAVAKSRSAANTIINVTRYGNVMGSRGSVIPLFAEQITTGKPVTLTDPTMTRFMMSLEQAVELVSYAFEHGSQGDIFVQKAPAASIHTLATAMAEVLGRPDHEIRTIGTRHGEKQHEYLLSREEMVAAKDLGDYYRVPVDDRDLHYEKFFEQGEVRLSDATDYSSKNTHELDVPAMQDLLLSLPLIQRLLAGAEKPAGSQSK